ncbi:uncharacterized protein LACBIDRAFT_311157 [Laccaria bicolor S238N-H82]|uniref:Predicted protein n=1 Tax=Laccaria bicolor (strain S238N-H82 / ATCC MYA-4686) TaxID=486041 RepID=B0CZD0_LACBS|nr:uncharacterized protein LACBIDRAFT_311157 [Laccaria bicolor S238N-H82]EDR12599.1 predicted protein [Laccaria bicolor S238N-H82]|eukprot:XP_001876863.1 predicted protein [Laccaria bicolor S238N-H82]
MEMLQMLKFSLKSGQSLDFTQGTSQEDVLEFIKSIQDGENAIPEDVNVYIKSLLATVE